MPASRRYRTRAAVPFWAGLGLWMVALLAALLGWLPAQLDSSTTVLACLLGLGIGVVSLLTLPRGQL